MKIDLVRLRKLSDEAVRRGEEERARILIEGREESQRKKRQEEIKAQFIIEQIPSRLEKEATAGRKHAIVMGVGYDDYDRPYNHKNWNECKPFWLKGVARLVFNACLEAELRPTIEFWHDGVGVESGFNIVAHF